MIELPQNNVRVFTNFGGYDQPEIFFELPELNGTTRVVFSDADGKVCVGVSQEDAKVLAYRILEAVQCRTEQCIRILSGEFNVRSNGNEIPESQDLQAEQGGEGSSESV